MKILGYTLSLLMATTATTATVEAQSIDVTRLNMKPLVQIHSEGTDFTGQPFQTDVFIQQGGYTLLAYSAATGNASRVARGIATQGQLMALNQALAAGQVGQQRGGCGGPAPDYVATYGLTWYGKQRVKSFVTGGNYINCSPQVVRILDGVCEFVWSVLGPSPEFCAPPSSPG